MRIPIAFALAWPARMAVSGARLDLAALGTLTFEAPDHRRFPALGICRAALAAGPASVTALSAANEIAVEAFLAGHARFLDICQVVEEVIETLDRSPEGFIAKSPSSFDEVFAVDRAARSAASSIAQRLATA
jgi:1-deoxy-D-xylulose-5-phosphate reductoisomerase